MQSRRMSLIETITSILIGLVVSFLSQVLIFKHFSIHITLAQNLEITLYFTVVSVIRSYAVRRFFNNYNKKNNDDYRQEI